MLHLMIDDKYPVMPWDEIDAVVFDVGRVLLAFDPPAILKEYLPEQPELHPILLRKVFQSPYWVMMDHGTLGPMEAAAAMASGAPELEEPIRTIMGSWVEMKDVIHEGVDALRLCKRMGKKVYILSNYGDAPFRVAEEKYDFFGLADAKFISSRLKLLKPDPCIYEHVVNATGHAPERMLFVDDAPANIESALHAGWQGLCYSEPGKLARFFTA